MYKANIRGAQDARQAIIRRQLGALKEGLLAQEIPLATVNRIKHKVVGSNGISYVARSHHSRHAGGVGKGPKGRSARHQRGAARG